MTDTLPSRTNPAMWLFLCVYIAACFVFWWLPSFLFWALDIPIEVIEPRFLWYSGGAMLLFIVGYFVPTPAFARRRTSPETLDACERLAWTATLVLAVPALLLATQFALYRSGVEYGEGEGIPLLYQAVLYTHLFFGLLYLGAAKDGTSRKRLLLAALLTSAPRLIISLHWGRFFAAQALIPIVLIAIARGWLRLSRWRIVQIALLGLLIIFVPSITRGDKLAGEDEQGKPQIVNFFQGGNTLVFLQNNLDLKVPCPPLLVSLTAKVVPYSALGLCVTKVGDQDGVPATMDVLLTREYSNDLMAGSGGNYLLELYLTGGLLVVIVGSILFGLSCRKFIQCISYRSLYAGIWAECLTRALLAPRGNLGYVYERIPSLILATLAVTALSWSLQLLTSQPNRIPVTHHS